MLRLEIGAETLRLESSLPVIESVRTRFEPFILGESVKGFREAPIHLRVTSTVEMEHDYADIPSDMLLTAGHDGTVRIDGPYKGHYSVLDRAGEIDGARGLGDLDALMRLALSLAVPLDNGLLIHGAAFDRPPGGIVICGDSGSGKSTTAAAFGAACDELSVLRVTEDGVELLSTPYWRGRPIRVPCRRILCLIRGGDPAISRLRPDTAFRSLVRHVVRYVAMDRVDRAAMRALARVCARVEVWSARCPTGDLFLPFVDKALSLLGANESTIH